MAYISLNYHSPTIGMHQNLTVILPEDQSFFNNDITAKPLKTLMLLHGLSSDETTYMRYTSIERYANEHKLAVIMPNVDHSAYANMAYGHSYYDYILEVYDYVHQIFPLSKKRDDNFIAGHSMGGYGTIKFALTQGDKFAKAVAEDKQIPKLLIMCGKQDFLYQDNLDFIDYLSRKNVPYQFEDGPGDHDYAYWDQAIKRAITWMVND
ncbi:TPA: esterase family protein [Staphylococcus aureus]|nr:esterase family protein [Staphylococcus aureus]